MGSGIARGRVRTTAGDGVAQHGGHTPNNRQCNIKMQRTANENAACLHRICKRFGLCHVVVPLSFLRSISLASLFAIPNNRLVERFSLGLPCTSLILSIHVISNWHLFKQGICWPVSRDHIAGSSLQLIEVTCFCEVDSDKIAGSCQVSLFETLHDCSEAG